MKSPGRSETGQTNSARSRVSTDGRV